MSRTPDDAATAILETVPLTMRVIRTQMRSGRPDGLSVPQFRLLRFVSRNAGTSLSAVADHLGASVPATSEQVERLVRGGFLTRVQCATERRRVELRLTDTGRSAMAECEARTRAWLCERLKVEDEADLDRLVEALGTLRSLLAEPLTEGPSR
jgi:DNA-binding MarR family transcriptional regulator